MTFSSNPTKPATDADAASAEPTPQGDASAKAPGSPKAVGSASEAALRMLKGAARYGVTSKDTVFKIVHLSRAPDRTLRRAAIPALAQIAGPAGYLPLIELLSDVNPTIQGEAAATLGNIGVPEAIEPLQALLSHDEPEVSLRAAGALGRLKDQGGLPVAMRFLRRDNPHARLAAHTLGVIVGRRFRPTPEGIAAARQYLKQTEKRKKRGRM